ncbi:MAG: hypothetical protein LBL82_00620 [Oscillospiraceae bacterium]|jgi:uncharacterized protein YjbI with pentapeptide repeats|nr:hypothetical protein [Oscillospiraceae bacterium]
MAFFKRFKEQTVDQNRASVLAEDALETQKTALARREQEKAAAAIASAPHSSEESGEEFAFQSVSNEFEEYSQPEPYYAPEPHSFGRKASAQQAAQREKTPAPAENGKQKKKKPRGKRFGGSRGANGAMLSPVLSFGVEEQSAAEIEKEKRFNEMTAEMDDISDIFSADITSPAAELGGRAGEEPKLPAFKNIAASVEQKPDSGDAPIIEPMQSLRAEKRVRRENRPKPENPVSLAFCDLSDREDLTAAEIEDASEIYGIKYPANFDTSSCDFSGRDIDFSNFSLCRSLKWEDIAEAADISGVVFPSSFDVENAEFFNISIRSCDFSAVYSLKWRHIEAAADIVAVKYPPTFNIADGQFTNRNISGTDFSLVSTMRWSNIHDASDITGIKYPASFDIENANYMGRDISRSDFSLVKNLRWEHISDAVGVKGIIYPDTFEFSDVNFAGKDISDSDFSNVKSFSFDSIAKAASVRGIKYPDCFDADSGNFERKNIAGSNFSRVSTLRWRHIKEASDIKRLVYPPQFDIDNADFTDRDIDFSDFALLPGFNWQSAVFAQSREGVVYPSGFVEPLPSDDEIQGAMIISLLKLYTSINTEFNTERLYSDVSALYPGIDDERAALLIENSSAVWEGENGKRKIQIAARSSYLGDKLYLLKLGFKLLYPKLGMEETLKTLRLNLHGIFKKHEQKSFDARLTDLSRGKYLSAGELSDIRFVPITERKQTREVNLESASAVITEQTAKISPAEDDTFGAGKATAPADSSSHDAPPVAEPARSKVYSFGNVPFVESKKDLPPAIPAEYESYGKTEAAQEAVLPAPIAEAPAAVTEEEEYPLPYRSADTEEPAPAVQSDYEQYSKPRTSPALPIEPVAVQLPSDRGDIPKPLDLSAVRAKKAEEEKRANRLSDEEKGIRTGVMGMLLYIHRSVSDESISNAELFSEFMKIYPGAAAKEVAAMAQFASNTLNGRNQETRARLFIFASKAPDVIKHKLLDFTYGIYIYRLSEPEDENIFREFLLALCNTLFEDSPEYEYSNFLRRHDILKNPAQDKPALYKRIPFDSGLGKANLYSNERYPFYRTLEQLKFSHFTFDAIKHNILIEVGDSRVYEELDKLIYREKNPNLMQFAVIETTLGFLYLEKRCLEDWGVSEDTVWHTAESNMQKQRMPVRYSFSGTEYTSFRYLQHDLASYVLTNFNILDSLAKGRDIILTSPCREIVYIDLYKFTSVKKMLEFSAHYNSSILIGGEEYEHAVTPDVFIYHAETKTLDRVDDESYILLGDSVARREVLHSVLPLNIDLDMDKIAAPCTTDEVAVLSDEDVTVQEAVYTILRVYCDMNGERDYTLPYNAAMGIFEELFISSDAMYPPARGREQPDPIAHIDIAAKMVVKAGKTVSWLLVQALSHLCTDIKYETPTSANIREAVLREIYGDNASAVWFNCATATEFDRITKAKERIREIMTSNQHLTILDAKIEVLMHALTLVFHQFGGKYALDQVRRHLAQAISDVTFNFEINQSAWLPSPGDDVDIEMQSQGMLLRGFDRGTQERTLATLANAIGDTDLSEGGWPLLCFIKLVKYAYLDPVEMVERYFVSRSRLIPSQAVLKQLYYKDLNSEFVKHQRKTSFTRAAAKTEDVFDERPSQSGDVGDVAGNFESVLAFDSRPLEALDKEDGNLRPKLQFLPVEPGYLEKRISFVLEPIDERVTKQLYDAAHFITRLFHVPSINFISNDDLECELHYGILRRKVQITTLRSMAWTIRDILSETGRDMRDVTVADIKRATEIVEVNNRLHYKTDGAFKTLCGMSLDDGMFVPAYEQILYFAQELMPETRLYSLFSLHEELVALAPSMKLIFDILREQKRGEKMPPAGVLFDTVCAWSVFALSCGGSFELAEGPSVYNYNQIQR